MVFFNSDFASLVNSFWKSLFSSRKFFTFQTFTMVKRNDIDFSAVIVWLLHLYFAFCTLHLHFAWNRFRV